MGGPSRLVSGEHLYNAWYAVAVLVTIVQRPAKVDAAIINVTGLKPVRLGCCENRE